jgi:hypothetical protein
MSNAPPPVRLDVKPVTLAMIVGGGLAIGALIVLGAIMPAEYNTDPLGLGKLSGVSRLWAPDQKTWKARGVAPATSSTTPIGHVRIDIPLGPNDWPERELEYKFALKPGQTILYKWTTTNLDDTPSTVPVEFDFHGEMTDRKGAITVAEYRTASALSDTGSLTAPFEGIHGWYFKNHSPDPTIVHLEVTGFYTLIPPGKPGNKYKIKPLEPELPSAPR